MDEKHRDWLINEPVHGIWVATSPNYDASYEGEEDGWVDNGEKVSARSREDLISEITVWIEEHEQCT